MGLIKELLIEKKIFDADAEVDKFMEANDVELGSIVQRIEFDKSIYENEDQVGDYLSAHYITGELSETKKQFQVSIYDEIAFIDSTMQTLEVRDGLSIVVGILRPMTIDNPVLFDDKSKNIKFSSDLPFIIELATVVNGFHARYGDVKITKKDLKSFKDNFENKVYGIDISIDFDHETREAAGWLNEVFLSVDSDKLYGVVKWTPKGALALNDREFRYFSPEFNLNFVHPHTGVSHGPTLLGGALVNRPFLKMDAIVGLKDKQTNGETKMDTISLSDHKTKVSEFEKTISDLKLSENTLTTKATGLEVENTKLSDELTSLKAEAVKKELVEKNEKLFSEGKINKAQLDALTDGKDMFEVLSLSEGMNTKPAGNGDKSKQIQLSEQEVALCKKMNLTEEDYIKYNGGAQ